MTNFDFLKSDRQFDAFSGAAASAEKTLPIDPSAAVINCWRAMELAVKWMYSVDGALTPPCDSRLAGLVDNEAFRGIVGPDIWQRMKLIRILGSDAANAGKGITREQAALCLENLYIFLDFVACCYGAKYAQGQFDPALLEGQAEPPPVPAPAADVDIQRLLAENKALKELLTARREVRRRAYVPKPLDLSEYKTRKLYIDAMLLDAGWAEGKNWLNEVELPGMPNKSGVGYADYVLCGDDGRPLAVVEAKRTCADVSKGRQQAKLYADILEKQHGRRPNVI